jgi:prepilin peptidase CpaA
MNLMIVLLVFFLLAAAIIDLKTYRIPNYLTFAGVLVACAYHTLSNGLNGFLFSLAGMAVGIGILIIPWIMEGMGAGDVKLMGVVGSFLGAKAVFGAFIFIALAGGIYSLALILIRRDVFKGFFSEKLLVLYSMVTLGQYVPIQTESSGQRPRLIYGVAIGFGTITYLLTKALGIKFFIEG